MSEEETLSTTEQRELYLLARELLQASSYDDLLDAVMGRSLSLLGADSGFLVLRQGEAFQYKVVRNFRREDLESDKEPLSRAILKRVFEQRRPLLIEDALHDPRFAKRESVKTFGIRSVLAAPLLVEREAIGALYVESHKLQNLFEERHLMLFEEILALSSRAISLGLRRLRLEQRNSLLERDLLARYNFQGIVTQHPRFLELLKTSAQLATSELPVLIQGPSGTGKELVARAIHVNSQRKDKPFLIINCSAISGALLESELFGYIKGAFTGANQNKSGLITAAHEGTLFLDEVGELPREFQAKLLRTLQFGEVLPVGAVQSHRVDVRFLAATNRDLKAEVASNSFREDLFYRLNAISLQLPTLRERHCDILLLFYHFIAEAAQRSGREIPEVTPKLERILEAYPWPGNIRELEHEAKRLLALTPPGAPLTAERLSLSISEAFASESKEDAAERDKELIEHNLRITHGNRTQTAKNLGITREGLRKKMKRYQIA